MSIPNNPFSPTLALLGGDPIDVGGGTVTITGLFTIGVPLNFYLTPSFQPTETLGLGLTSSDGTTVSVTFPAKPAGTGYQVQVISPTEAAIYAYLDAFEYAAGLAPASIADPLPEREWLWIVALEIGGHVYRYCTEAVEILTAAGESLVYAEGLEDPGVSLGETYGTGDTAVSITISADVDWSQIVADGHALDQCPATLSRWRRGTVLERSRLVLRGLTSGPVWGAPEEGLQVAIRRSPRGLAVTVPDPQAVVDGITFDITHIPESATGAMYPIVIGCPGGTESETPTPVVPVPHAQYLDPLQSQTEDFTGYDSTLGPDVIPLLYHPKESVRVYIQRGGTGPFVEVIKAADWYVIYEGVTDTASLVVTNNLAVVAADVVRIVYSYLLPATYAGTRSTLVWIGQHATSVRLLVRPAGKGYGDLSSDQSVTQIRDSLDRTLQAVERPFPLPGGDADGLGATDDAFFLGFKDVAGYGGGILSVRGEMLRGAGDVIEYVLTRWYLGPIDGPRIRSVRTYLNRWKIDTYINTPTNAWDWLTREILPLLPVEMREGADGLYPAVIRYDLTTADAVAHLDADPVTGRVERSSSVTLTDGDIANEITIEYRPLGEVGSTWLGRRVLSARAGRSTVYSSGTRRGVDRELVTDSRILGSALCSASQARYGVRPLSLQASAVWDTSTAVLTLQHLASRYAWPRRQVDYTGGEWLEAVEIGAAVTVSDPDLYLTDAVAVVVDVKPYGSAGVVVSLVLLDSPVT